MQYKQIILFVIFLFIVEVIPSQETKRVEIIHSESMDFDKKSGINATKLIGNVRFQHGNVIMDCDSAYFYSESNKIDAFSRIHISQGDTLHLYGEKLFYDGDIEIAKMRENVKLIDKQTVLTTQYMDYNLKDNIGYYYNNGNIINANNKLRSNKGFYYASIKLFIFKTAIVIENPDYTIESDTMRYNTVSRTAYFLGPTTITSKENLIYSENGWYNTNTNISQFQKNAYLLSNKQMIKGDSLYYEREKGIGKAFHNVFIIDSAKNVIVTGNYVYYIENPQFALVTDSAQMIKYGTNDSLFLHADTFRITSDTLENRWIKGYYKVKFFKPDFQGMCDSITYISADSIMKLNGNPVIWANSNQLSSDSVHIQFKDSTIDRVIYYNNALIVSESDTGIYNQTRGKNMTALFKSNQLYKVELKGNGESIYHVYDNQGYIGLNKVECTDIDIYVSENRLQRIVTKVSPVGTLYPPDQIPAEVKYLQGFNWKAEHRPKTRYDIFNWVVK